VSTHWRQRTLAQGTSAQGVGCCRGLDYRPGVNQTSATHAIATSAPSLNGDHATAIALVGMSGRIPGANSVQNLWSNLRAGVVGLRELTDEEMRAVGMSRCQRPGGCNCTPSR
jgi:uncharacterized protein YjiS (DUF1127 family)